MAEPDDSASKLISVSVSRQSKRIHLRTRRFPAVLAGCLFVAPWILVALYYFGYLGGIARDPSRPRFQIKPGPWGQLDAFEYVTDPPDGFINSQLFPPADVVWTIGGGLSREAVKTILDKAEFSAADRDQLLASAELSPNQEWKLKPSDDLIVNMTPNGRASLYQELVKYVPNTRQIDPFIFEPKRLDDWLKEAAIDASTMALLKKLCYKHHDQLLLADTSVLLKRMPTENDKHKLLAVLLRRPTFMLKMRINENTDVRKLAEYWGSGGRQGEVLSQLEPMRHNGGMREDILMLLPSFARDRLYTYPLPDSSDVAQHRDCHWSAFNFFNATPDDRLTVPKNVIETLDNEYVPVKEPTMGDVTMLKTPDGRIIHSSVYIADDFYFTKNGPSHISPWVLMRMDDIMAFFPAYENLSINYYRRKK